MMKMTTSHFNYEELVRNISSKIQSSFQKPIKGRAQLTYCAPFYDTNENIWVLELKKKGSDTTAQVRITMNLDNDVFETVVGEVNNFLTGIYE